jgi:hypothetical protein
MTKLPIRLSRRRRDLGVMTEKNADDAGVKGVGQC